MPAAPWWRLRGLRPPSTLREGPRKPLKSNQTLCTPQGALVCCKLYPHPDVTSQGSPICPHPGDGRESQSQLGSGACLGGPGTRVWQQGGSYPAQTRSPARLGCQESWPDHRSWCRAREEPGSAGTGREEGTLSGIAMANTAGSPNPGAHPQSQSTSSIPGVHPPSQNAGPARHRRLPGAPGTKGLAESANFSPQLDLIFSSNAPTAGGGMAEERRVRQGKAGRWQRAEGQAGPARPHTAAGLIWR